jgi:putative transposase
LVQSRKNKKGSGKDFLKVAQTVKVFNQKIITDKLKSYVAAHREMKLSAVHETDQYQYNRGKSSHQRTRQQKRSMRRFKSAGHAQKFLSVHGAINNLSRQDRPLLFASSYRTLRNIGFDELKKVSGLVPVN